MCLCEHTCAYAYMYIFITYLYKIDTYSNISIHYLCFANILINPCQ